jgi:hypothetical protein
MGKFVQCKKYCHTKDIMTNPHVVAADLYGYANIFRGGWWLVAGVIVAQIVVNMEVARWAVKGFLFHNKGPC